MQGPLKQLPIIVKAARKSDVRSQFAALCFRRERGKLRVLLVTSRGSKRWIVPKGWPMDRMTPAACAARASARERVTLIAPPVAAPDLRSLICARLTLSPPLPCVPVREPF